MRKFFGNIIVFLSCLVVVLVVADFFFSRLFRNADSPNMIIWKDVMEGKASSDLLICGDSRANTDCYPPVIDSITGLRSYSLGTVGHHFSIQKLRYDMYRRHNDKPMAIVQFVDPWTFSSVKKHDYDMSQFLPWMWDWDFFKSALLSEPKYFAVMTFPWVRYRTNHLFDIKDPSFKVVRGSFTYEVNHFRRYLDEDLKFSSNSRNKKRFREYLTDLSMEGINVVLVIAPICGSGSNMGESLQKTRSFYNTLGKEYGIPVLDYLQKQAFEDSTLFIDSIHLNMKGALMFSDSLANDILALGLLNN